MTAREALAKGIGDLAEVGVSDPTGDARRLMAQAMGIELGRLTLHLGDDLLSRQEAEFRVLLDRRRARQPISQILGRRDFFGRSFKVTPDVLDPRPETETLVARALEVPWTRVLDLGTGSGCILVTLLAERTGATGTGVDLSPSALAVAEGNGTILGIGERATFLQSNWFEQVAGRFDLIVSNPPYIDDSVYAGLEPELRDWEPEMALRAGDGGLDAYRRIVLEAKDYLAPGGRLLLEIGWDQRTGVSELLSSSGFADIATHADLDGRDRVLEGCWQE